MVRFPVVRSEKVKVKLQVVRWVTESERGRWLRVKVKVRLQVEG